MGGGNLCLMKMWLFMMFVKEEYSYFLLVFNENKKAKGKII